MSFEHFYWFSAGMSEQAYGRDPKLVDLERRLHHGPSGQLDPDNLSGLDGWAADHQGRYTKMTVLDYDPLKYPYQRIDVSKTPPSQLLDFMPSRLLSIVMRRKYVQTMGVRGKNALSAFDNTAAFEGQSVKEGAPSISKALGEIALRGESIAILTSHADGVDDVGTYHGPTAIALAGRSGRLIKRAGSVLNNVQSREQYKGKPIADHFNLFGTIYWTVPDTDSTEKWELEDDVIYNSRRGFLEAVSQDREKGLALTLAPVGKAMGRIMDEKTGGLESLYQSKMNFATAKMISRFSHFIVTASWEENVNVSHIIDLPALEKLPKKEQNRVITDNANQIQRMLAQQTADLSQKPVVYELMPDNGETRLAIAEPLPLAA